MYYVQVEEKQKEWSKVRLATLAASFLIGLGGLMCIMKVRPLTLTMKGDFTEMVGRGLDPVQGGWERVQNLHFAGGNAQSANAHPVFRNTWHRLGRSLPVLASVDPFDTKIDHQWETASMPTYDYDTDFKLQIVSGMRACREQSNSVVPLLEQLRTHDFFSYFPFDLMAPCSHMPTEEAPCEISKCEVEPAESVPEKIRARDEDEYEFDLDGWTRKDMPSDFTEYYDVREVPESYTEYEGQRIWRFIHQKICFQQGLQERDNGWKRDFNRAVSGMHSAVHAQIIEDMGFTDESRVQYRRRLRDEPGAITNLYFAYMLTLVAIYENRDVLVSCKFLGEGNVIRPVMKELLDTELLKSETVQAAALELRRHADSSVAEEWQARIRCRDLYAIMNCVQCNKCRMHGKIMAIGLGAALQMVLGTAGMRKGEDPKKLDRVQLGALVATAAKFGIACQTVERFREWDGEDISEPFSGVLDRAEQPTAMT